MTDRAADHDDADSPCWLDAPASALARRHAKAVRDVAARMNELADMEAALDALRRHPDAATAREACRRECLLAQSRLVA